MNRNTLSGIYGNLLFLNVQIYSVIVIEQLRTNTRVTIQTWKYILRAGLSGNLLAISLMRLR